MSIQITGGSTGQQAFIRTAHAQAISMATAAQAAAAGGGATFATWFGAAPPATVAAHFGELTGALQTYAWTYDLTTLLDSFVEPDVFLSPKTVNATAATATLAAWRGVFLQDTAASGQRMVALSAIHVVAEIREGWTLPSFILTAQAAQRYAVVDPAGAATCPRNYMEFAGAVTP